MALERSLSIVIPAYCEADNIVETLDNVVSALAPLGLPHEILVIDDGSTDETGARIRANLSRFPTVTLLVNERNIGSLDLQARRGRASATSSWCMATTRGRGDAAELFRHSVKPTWSSATRATWRTRAGRALISKAFTSLVNLIKQRGLRYYNGLQIHSAPILKRLRIESTGFGFQPEVLVKSLRLSRSFIEVPMDLMERERGRSKAFRLKNAVDVIRTLRLLCGIEWGLAGK